MPPSIMRLTFQASQADEVFCFLISFHNTQIDYSIVRTFQLVVEYLSMDPTHNPYELYPLGSPFVRVTPADQPFQLGFLFVESKGL